ncbi:MAG: polysaccharide export protein, partial [Phycisphaerae bacterium]|nr:polysaccharide export protein [Phycisphaerae bacterium]
IRSDGKISLRLLGEVQISGMTPEEASATLEELLSKYYESPQAIVRVVSFESKHIRISGQVRLPGNYPFTGRDTVLDLIASAHPTFLAWGANVKVIRPNANPEERHEIIVDIDKMLRTGDTTKNFLLQEGDMVYVPPTPLGWVGLRFQELLFPISPALSLTNSPVQLRNTSDDMQYGNINNASEYRERRGWR